MPQTRILDQTEHNAGHAQCGTPKPILMSHHPRLRAPTLALHLFIRSAQLNSPNEVRHWHKSAPLLITAVTILAVVIILYH
jgi:hypothetical protein